MRVLCICMIPLVLAGVSLPAVASEGGGLGEALIKPELGTIVWTLLTFIFMVMILGRFAWKPLLGALQDREKSIESSLDQARQDREQAEEILAQQRQMLVEAHRERSAALEKGRQDAEKLREEILEQARKQREQLLKQTEDQIQAGMRQARTELRVIAVDLAIQAAEKLLTKNLDDAAQRQLVEDYLADLERGEGTGQPTA